MMRGAVGEVDILETRRNAICAGVSRVKWFPKGKPGTITLSSQW